MNMPPPSSKIDFLNDDFRGNSPNSRRLSFNNGLNTKLFSNHKINNGLQRFDSINEPHHLKNNFINDDNLSYL